MPDIVITEEMDEAVVLDLHRAFDVHYDHRLATDVGALTNAVADARALIVRDCTLIDVDLLEAAPHLRVIGCLGDCYGLVDEAACRARGIEVHRIDTAGNADIALRAVDAVIDLLGKASAEVEPARAVEGRLLGLVGFGPTAREVALRARALGLHVAAYDPLVDDADAVWSGLGVQPRSLHVLLEECDAISLHLPLTEETRHLIDWELLLEMRPGAVLVNASRTGIVDRGAVAAALDSGRLSGALLDLGRFAPEALRQVDAARSVVGALLAARVREVLEAGNLRVSAV